VSAEVGGTRWEEEEVCHNVACGTTVERRALGHKVAYLRGERRGASWRKEEDVRYRAGEKEATVAEGLTYWRVLKEKMGKGREQDGAPQSDTWPRKLPVTGLLSRTVISRAAPRTTDRVEEGRVDVHFKVRSFWFQAPTKKSLQLPFITTDLLNQPSDFISVWTLKWVDPTIGKPGSWKQVA
jgi:hypothetical protein